jgi:hypothetical protein
MPYRIFYPDVSIDIIIWSEIREFQHLPFPSLDFFDEQAKIESSIDNGVKAFLIHQAFLIHLTTTTTSSSPHTVSCRDSLKANRRCVDKRQWSCNRTDRRHIENRNTHVRVPLCRITTKRLVRLTSNLRTPGRFAPFPHNHLKSIVLYLAWIRCHIISP